MLKCNFAKLEGAACAQLLMKTSRSEQHPCFIYQGKRDANYFDDRCVSK